MQLKLNIKQSSKLEIVLILGVGKDDSDINSLSNRFNTSLNAKDELEKVKLFWGEKLSTIQVETPDPSMNILLNGWLLYQVLSCRMWARSAFYQSGGAFGFRDQLQDCLSLSIIWPEIAREQIIKHAAHQFVEGDVLHWWHEPGNRGTRTRISDDYLWLAYVTAEYIRITGDSGILDSEIPFIEANLLDVYEEERYLVAQKSERTATLYDHCILSLENAMKFGEHGLPLMGSGDWNDGMNTVGNLGKGESVWLGWFLASTIKKFVPICDVRGDILHSRKYSLVCDDVVNSIEETAWDGNWYKRAYFDNGAALGSVNNTDCKIDSLAQTWATISGLGDHSRASIAMSSMENYLVSREDGLIKLLSPPFDNGESEPGYIKSYVPGIRENGGQYTHAAAWVIEAFSHLKNGDKAVELFGLINPINHSRTNLESAVYKVEPYVIAADVYSSYPHNGRGGWTWYTGSANWIYRVGLENILGFQKNGEKLLFKPCVPTKWKSYKIKYTYLQTVYNITFKNPNALGSGQLEVSENGKLLTGNEVSLVNDKGLHEVEVVIITT